MTRKTVWLPLVLAITLLTPVLARAQFVGCLNIRQIPSDECDALEKFFFQTNGPFWYNNRGWLRSNQPCSWFGITCTDTPWPKHVSKIHLISNNVGGSLPAELSILSQLKELVIENRDAVSQFATLSSGIPSALSDLSELEVLQLSRNNLRGPVPGAFNKLSKLRVLLLDDNDLTGPIPTSLGDNSQLEALNLADNDLFGTIPPELGRLEKLRHLDLSQNNLESTIPPELGNLTNLVSMGLHLNNLSGSIPSTLSNIRPIWLSLANNNLGGPLDLTTVTTLNTITTCFLSPNAPSLCIPDSPSFRALGTDMICGLPLSSTCGSPYFINFLSLDAVIDGETILLRWSTDQGAPNIDFEIEQEREGTFVAIGSVAGFGARDQAQSFSFRVTDPGQSPYTFRLKQVDIDGNALYGPEITVQTVPSDFVFEPAFPNPFRSTTTLRFAIAEQQDVTAALYDVSGRRIKTLFEGTPAAYTTQLLHIEASDLPAGGHYFVRITGANGYSTTQEILFVK